MTINRGQNVIRIIQTFELLARPQGATYGEIAEILEVHERTARRNVDIIMQLGIEIIEIGREGKFSYKASHEYVRKIGNTKFPCIFFSVPELIALFLMKTNFTILNGTQIEGYINSAFEKIASITTLKVSDMVNTIKKIYIKSYDFDKDYTEKEKIIDIVNQAIIKKKQCKMSYYSFAKENIAEYNISPLCFFSKNGGLYLFVRFDNHKDVRTIAVERIQKITLLNKNYKYPRGFNPEKLLENSFGVIFDDPVFVKIWFSSSQAKYIDERVWSTREVKNYCPDGSIILELNTSGWFDVKRWILGFGADAKLLEPRELVEELRSDLQRALNAY
ncbi:helix-turn-helix transcriptional regulator [Desulfovibrio sp. TomC]|uniref:helix-turn-helix transcriptional regulator n=1 Tax=Desulfovibrio sp. TomC TaxID=1562888 RepID=UPI0009E65CA5|nr:WYL domain-containing protein [Desulfovibrio sp. TomC]